MAATAQTLWLIMNFLKLRTKMFYKIGPWLDNHGDSIVTKAAAAVLSPEANINFAEFLLTL